MIKQSANFFTERYTVSKSSYLAYGNILRLSTALISAVFL